MNRNVILAGYHQRPEGMVNLFVETYTKQELRTYQLKTPNKQLEEIIEKLVTLHQGHTLQSVEICGSSNHRVFLLPPYLSNV